MYFVCFLGPKHPTDNMSQLVHVVIGAGEEPLPEPTVAKIHDII